MMIYEYYERQNLTPLQRRQKLLQYLEDVHDMYHISMEEVDRLYAAGIELMEKDQNYWK